LLTRARPPARVWHACWFCAGRPGRRYPG
jgi:hypothetical protein